jgi:hypothetical protein
MLWYFSDLGRPEMLDRTNVRAFPRLSWTLPATLVWGDTIEPAQIGDISQGGCKVMPLALTTILSLDIRPGMRLEMGINGHRIAATIRWATANYSALGCAFDEPLDTATLMDLGVMPAAAE